MHPFNSNSPTLLRLHMSTEVASIRRHAIAGVLRVPQDNECPAGSTCCCVQEFFGMCFQVGHGMVGARRG